MIISIQIKGNGIDIMFKGELTLTVANTENSEKAIATHVCGIRLRNVKRRIKTIMEKIVKGAYPVTLYSYSRSNSKTYYRCKFKYQNVPRGTYTDSKIWNYKEDIMYEMIQILEENSYILISSHHDVFNPNLPLLSKTIMTFRNMRFVS